MLLCFPLEERHFSTHTWPYTGLLDTLEGEFPLLGGNELFIQWHGGLSTALTAAEVALRLRTSTDMCLMYILFHQASRSLFVLLPLALHRW